MTRIKGGVTTKRKHKKILKLAKGYWMSRSKHIKKAAEAVLHAGEYAFAGRRLKKRQFRRLWITRLGATLRLQNVKYSTFMNALKKKHIELDRKVLAQLAVEYPGIFKNLVEKVMS